MSTVDNIFLDFDETLAHTLFGNDEKHAEDLLYDYGEVFMGEKYELSRCGWHVTFKRPLTNHLIQFCRELVGHENVYILTTGIREYIIKCNEVLNMGFNPDTHLFAREDIKKNTLTPHPNFINCNNILVDNLEFMDHRDSKVKFLDNLQRSKYVQVEDFLVWTEPLELENSYLDDIQHRILEALRA